MERSSSDWPWPNDEPSTGGLRDRIAASHQRLIDQMITTTYEHARQLGVSMITAHIEGSGETL